MNERDPIFLLHKVCLVVRSSFTLEEICYSEFVCRYMADYHIYLAALEFKSSPQVIMELNFVYFFALDCTILALEH